MQENDAVEAVNTGLQGGFDIRTDLALEQRESFEGDGGEISGVKLKEWHHQKSQVKLTEVKILNDQGARAMGKPKGTYLTLEADRLSKEDDEYHSEISEELARQIRKLMGEMINWKEKDLPSVLVVGDVYKRQDGSGCAGELYHRRYGLFRSDCENHSRGRGWGLCGRRFRGYGKDCKTVKAERL